VSSKPKRPVAVPGWTVADHGLQDAGQYYRTTFNEGVTAYHNGGYIDFQFLHNGGTLAQAEERAAAWAKGHGNATMPVIKGKGMTIVRVTT